MIPGFKVAVLSISLNDKHFYYTKEIFNHPSDRYPKNEPEEIKLIIRLIGKRYLKESFLPIDICAVWDMDDNIVWSEPAPDYQADLITIPED